MNLSDKSKAYLQELADQGYKAHENEDERRAAIDALLAELTAPKAYRQLAQKEAMQKAAVPQGTAQKRTGRTNSKKRAVVPSRKPKAPAFIPPANAQTPVPQEVSQDAPQVEALAQEAPKSYQEVAEKLVGKSLNDAYMAEAGNKSRQLDPEVPYINAEKTEEPETEKKPSFQYSDDETYRVSPEAIAELVEKYGQVPDDRKMSSKLASIVGITQQQQPEQEQKVQPAAESNKDDYNIPQMQADNGIRPSSDYQKQDFTKKKALTKELYGLPEGMLDRTVNGQTEFAPGLPQVTSYKFGSPKAGFSPELMANLIWLFNWSNARNNK